MCSCKSSPQAPGCETAYETSSFCKSLQVDVGTETTGSLWDKVHLLVVALLGTVFSGYLLSPLAPSNLLLSFNMHEAREAADQVRTGSQGERGRMRSCM